MQSTSFINIIGCSCSSLRAFWFRLQKIIFVSDQTTFVMRPWLHYPWKTDVYRRVFLMVQTCDNPVELGPDFTSGGFNFQLPDCFIGRNCGMRPRFVIKQTFPIGQQIFWANYSQVALKFVYKSQNFKAFWPQKKRITGRCSTTLRFESFVAIFIYIYVNKHNTV